MRDAFRTRKEGIGCGDYFVAGSDFVCFQEKRDCRRSGTHADAMFHAAVCCELLLEMLYVRSQREGGTLNYVLYGRVDFPFDGLVLCAEVEEGDGHVGGQEGQGGQKRQSGASSSVTQLNEDSVQLCSVAALG